MLIQQRATVQKGGRVEVQSDELPEGATVEVTIAVDDEDDEPFSLADVVGKGSGLFKSVEEVDAYIRAERDSWHS